ncbi:MAG TPA: ABC transporter substrate-binding protein [Candidatus Binatia bacterium]|nr:ABC transporter substrate-binding protein [Candidatus Binatia bacterium]
MTIKIFICSLLTVFLLAVSLAQAQQPTKVPRIGYVGPATTDPRTVSFRQGLRDLGYTEEKNILVEYGYVGGKLDQFPDVVAELVHLKVDVLVAVPFQAILAAKQATKTIPIVMVTTLDPVATGIVDSLAQPGGNITGLARLTRVLGGKRLELIKEVDPKISRVGVLWAADDQGSAIGFKDYETAAHALKIPLQSLGARGPNPDLESAFGETTKGPSSALIAIRGGLLNRYQKRIADLAIENRLPSIFEGNDFVEAGGLMSYTTNDDESFRRAAVYVDMILKGAKPANLPVEQPKKFEFIINLKAAKQIRVTIPHNVLARADKVIK